MQEKLFTKIENKKGSTLAFVLVAVIIVAITMTSLLTYISSQLSYSKDRVERERAFEIAESGAYYYRWYLAHQVSGKTAEQIKNFWESGSPEGVGTPLEVEYVDPELGAIGKYKLEVTKPALGSTIVVVKSTGWTYLKPSVKKVVQVRFRRPSWSENSVLANDNMRFGDGTTVTGKMHSNKGIRFDGVATNIISSSLATYDDPDHSGGNEFGVHTHANVAPATGVNDAYRAAEALPNAVPARTDVFQAGRTFPAPQLDFNSVVSDISFMRSQATVKFDNSGKGMHIKLKTDGTMDTCRVNTFDPTSNDILTYTGIVKNGSAANNNKPCTTITAACCTAATCAWIKPSDHNKGQCISSTSYTIPNNGIVFVANNLWLEGTIDNKKVSFVADELSDEPQGGGVANTGGNKNVFLGMNNLLYANSNGLSNGTDIIGIIAQKDVEIIQNSQSNLTIDAALLAKEGRVGRQPYGSNKSTITINGSIATNIRYGFAYVGNTYNCGSGVTVGDGYCFRNINFDNNLLYFPPPYFPTGTEYAIDQWDEL
ncbi:MAG: hypothetical protein WCI36_04580 [bacterium]